MKRVLVADDKATGRELIRTVLEQCGHSVFEAVDGIDAMTWKGEGLTQALPSFGVLVFFGLALAIFAGTKFKWSSSST